jgi:hypothetical protein
MPRPNAALFSGTITALTMVLAIIAGGFTAGTISHVADDTGTTTVTPAPPTDQPDGDGHGWID